MTPQSPETKPPTESLTKNHKITYTLAALSIAVAVWGILRSKGDAKPEVVLKATIIPPDRDMPGDRRRGGERIDFHHGTVEVSDPDIENRIARIAVAVKSLPVGAQAEIIADIGERDDANELLATERTKLVKNLLVTAGISNDRLRVLIQNDRTTPTYTLHAVNVRWSYPEP